jgi:polyribonucleotide nucleotidyltransferase
MRKNNAFYINPKFSEMEGCDLDLMVAATMDSIVMVEGEMREVSEEVMLEALKLAHEALKPMIQLQLDFRAAAGKPIRKYDKLEEIPELAAEIKSMTWDTLYNISKAIKSANYIMQKKRLLPKNMVRNSILEHILVPTSKKPSPMSFAK